MKDTINDRAYVVYGENDTKKFNFIDSHFANLAKQMGAVEYQIPALIDGDILKKCGYLNSFPHHLTIPCYVKNEKYKHVMNEQAVGIDDLRIGNKFLTPSACLHIYPCLSGKEFESKVITTKARVYRSEDREYDGKVRLWDFSVREIVFAGNKEFVLGNLEHLKIECEKFCEKIGLPINVIASSDHFYPTKKNLAKSRLQKQNLFKYELVTEIDGQKVSLASFNFHDKHFSKPFQFDCNNKVTGCVGFGLERWVTALNYYEVGLKENEYGF